MTEVNQELETKINKIFQIANNAIYFNDSSDYLTALYEICNVIVVERGGRENPVALAPG